MDKYISKDKLKLGSAYLVHARNFKIAIWDGEQFNGLRSKFGSWFMDTELHWDEGPPHGTARPLKELE